MTPNSAYVDTECAIHSIVKSGYVEGFWLNQQMKILEYIFDRPIYALLIDNETELAIALGKIDCHYTIFYETAVSNSDFLNEMFLGETNTFKTIDGSTYETTFHGSFGLDETVRVFGNKIDPDNCLSSLRIPWLKVKRV